MLLSKDRILKILLKYNFIHNNKFKTIKKNIMNNNLNRKQLKLFDFLFKKEPQFKKFKYSEIILLLKRYEVKDLYCEHCRINLKNIEKMNKRLQKYCEDCKYLYRTKLFKNNPKQEHLKNLENLNKEYIKNNFLDNQKLLLKEFKNYYGYIGNSRPYQLLRKFNIEYKLDRGYSQAEKEIVDFIKSIYDGNIIENDREIIKPKELDILIPDKSLAIEYNGLFWHSDDKYRHLKKTEACESKNINLLHIFENEWLNPRTQEIWKSVISYKLGITKEKYFARKLEIKKVHTKEANEFLNENHLQGTCPAKVKLGLYYKNELISLMTFAKPRFNKDYEYELIRFASKKFTTCVGCAQRLFKHFLREYQPKSIISYANRRWASSLSNLYKSIGFKFLRISNPNFYYFKLDDPELKLYHRVKYQKHKLKDFPNYSPSKTAESIMIEAGYRRIYDSGNLVYEYQS